MSKKDKETPYICGLIDRRIRELGIPATEVAEALGVADATVSQWRRFKIPSGARWSEICQVLQIDPAEMVAQSAEFTPSGHGDGSDAEGDEDWSSAGRDGQGANLILPCAERYELELAHKENQLRIERLEQMSEDLLRMVRQLQEENTSLHKKYAASIRENMELKKLIIVAPKKGRKRATVLGAGAMDDLLQGFGRDQGKKIY